MNAPIDPTFTTATTATDSPTSSVVPVTRKSKAKAPDPPSKPAIVRIPLTDARDTFVQLAQQHPEPAAYWRSAIRWIATQLDVLAVGSHGQLDNHSLTDFACVERFDETQKKELRQTIYDALIARQCDGGNAMAGVSRITGEDFMSVTVTYALEKPCLLDTSVCILIHPEQTGAAQSHAAQLQSLMTQAAMHLPYVSHVAEPETDIDPVHCATRVAQYHDTREFAFALVASLANRFACSQVSLGIGTDHHVKVFAVSGLDRFKATSPGIVDIQQAMEEARDHQAPIVGHAHPHSGQIASMPIHDRFAGRENNAVLSIPIMASGLVPDDETNRQADDRCIAVVTLKRKGSSEFSDRDVQNIVDAVAPFGPGIAMSLRADRKIGEHIRQTARQTLATIKQPKSTLGYRTRCVAIAAALIFVFGWMPYKPSTPCVIVPTDLTQTMASFDMTLDAAPANAGDRVKKGQLLAAFDTSELEMQRASLVAQRNQAEVDVRFALSEGDAAAASLAKASAAAQQAQLDNVNAKIQQCRIVAPHDGMVVSADLQSKIGQVFPQGEPILSFATMDRWDIQLQVPERLSRFIQRDQVGTFATSANPADSFNYTIRSVSGATELIEGKNVLVATATIEGEPSVDFRQGLKGVAKTKTGWRPVFWVALHGAYEYTCGLMWL